MAITRSSAAERRTQTATTTSQHRAPRNTELLSLLLGSVLIMAGLALVWSAKTAPFSQLAPDLINLNSLERREQLLPALMAIAPTARERQLLAARIFERSQAGSLPNVGALGRNRLLSAAEVSNLKPLVIVRSPGSFVRAALLWITGFFLAFYALHFFWRFRNFGGEQAILPAIHLLTGTGLILMFALRDPLRDTLSFADFSQSVLIGTAAMAVASSLDINRLLGRLSYLPLLAAIALSLALVLFGTGPGTSDAKVNLLGFQPVEIIKILITFFLAGYFATRWEFLRVLKERRPELANITRHVDLPRLEYALPVLLAVGLTLVFFFVQKDLGPALVISCVFLSLYSVARGRALLATCGLILLGLGFLVGYLLHIPRTVSDRVAMWLSPWDNSVRGGEQVVHALWAFSTGGLFGTGPGLGDPGIMPAAHTDLILAVLGEEWGWFGVAGVFLIFAMLTGIGLRIAMRARTDYNFFLALGVSLLNTFSLVLIAAGVLDLFPLSGVVTPFLSYGGTAMIANFTIFGVLAGLSRDTEDSEHTAPFRVPVRRLAQLLAILCFVIVSKAAWIQIARADVVTGAGALTLQGDGFRRYRYNPRLMAIARSIPRGSVFDKKGVVLATSDLKLLDERTRQGVNPAEARFYPLGAYGVHLLGDLRTRANWGARNSSLIERDSMVRLQGYNDRAHTVEVAHPVTKKPAYTVRHDYRELVPLMRHRLEPNHPEVRKVFDRKRDVQTSIDARLQIRSAQILEAGLKRLRRDKGAVVVLDPVTGDLLASVSYPWPARMPPELGPDDGTDELLDRARYGLYPPGSTFKIVTAMAALRKDANTAKLIYQCKALPDGRVGNSVKGWGRPIRDDVQDRTPHGAVDMQKGTVVSCNAYYAQLGTYAVGAEALKTTADLLGIATGNLKDPLPQASYGQGQVVASPFQMARAAAAVANGGSMPFGRWVTDESNSRIEPPVSVLNAAQARVLGSYMRGAVTSGTGRALTAAPVAVAGKTGTAELEKKPSHAWFIGFAPYGSAPKIAFAVLVENGQYGGSAAAPIAREIVAAAQELGLLQ
ncbi:MAG: FtsW/RodA/SpoVE family cell cycle protein [Bryobacteraceae bacterium]|nr:FtsW/RodA/SpoVE family cell cycle protein [Bryobacteraceae bacterium]